MVEERKVPGQGRQPSWRFSFEIDRRPPAVFGVAYAFDSISGDLKDALDPLARLRDEHQFEVFYNFALTPWCYLTGDLQVVRPSRPRADTAIVPGLRMRFVF